MWKPPHWISIHSHMLPHRVTVDVDHVVGDVRDLMFPKVQADRTTAEHVRGDDGDFGSTTDTCMRRHERQQKGFVYKSKTRLKTKYNSGCASITVKNPQMESKIHLMEPRLVRKKSHVSQKPFNPLIAFTGQMMIFLCVTWYGMWCNGSKSVTNVTRHIWTWDRI